MKILNNFAEKSFIVQQGDKQVYFKPGDKMEMSEEQGLKMIEMYGAKLIRLDEPVKVEAPVEVKVEAVEEVAAVVEVKDKKAKGK